MANTKATLVRYGKTTNGWKRGTLIAAKNGRTKPDAMIVSGVEVSIPADSQYQIRYYDGAKVKYQSVGTDYEAAKTTLEKYTASRQRESADEALGIIKPEVAEAEKTLEVLLDEFLAAKKSPSLDLSTDSIHLYTSTLPEFVRVSGKQYAKDITCADVVRFMDSVKRDGYAVKTCTIKYVAVRGFLKYCGVNVAKVIDQATHRRLAVKVEGNTDPYTQAELDKLFAVCNDYYRTVFTFLLSTGMRYREANHITWADIDWQRGIINVRG